MGFMRNACGLGRWVGTVLCGSYFARLGGRMDASVGGRMGGGWTRAWYGCILGTRVWLRMVATTQSWRNGSVGGRVGAVGRCPSEYWLPCMGPAPQRVAWVGRCLGLHGMDRMQQAARRTMSG